jgi:hypothetical protein
MSSADLNREPVWKVLYEAAILEVNPHIVQQRIDEASAAIKSQQKFTQEASNESEKEHLNEALDALDTLANMRLNSR